MNETNLDRDFALLKEKFDRHEKILIQAYKSLKKKEQELVSLNHELQSSEIELQETNEELRVTNEALKIAYEEIKTHNENLDELVRQRSKEIEDQLSLFHRYAYLNSHEVRAPLARILGLISLINYEEENQKANPIIEKLSESARELDGIVRRMNRLLEEGTFPNKID